MKRLTTFLLTAALIFQGAIALAQIDEAKMERDLRVASGVLASLIKSDEDDMVFGRDTPEGNYVEGFGVIFTVEDIGSFRYNYGYVSSREMKREIDRAYRETNREYREANRVYGEASKEYKEVPKSLKNTKPVADSGSTGTFKITGSEKEVSEIVEKSVARKEKYAKVLKEAFGIFLMDYSQLISQLKPTDKFLLTTKPGSGMDFIFAGDKYGTMERSNSSSLSAEMLVKDHRDFTAGEISREKLLTIIKFIENTEMEYKPDLDLFSNMLKTTYSSKYTETYFMSSIPKYEVLNGLGVIYSVKVFSSYEQGKFYMMPTINKVGMSEEERNKMVEEMYPQFVEDFKENIIRYGSTIKSLESSDKLILKVKMTKCGTCTFPSSIEFIVDKLVLDQFSKGSLTLSQAKEKVKFK